MNKFFSNDAVKQAVNLLSKPCDNSNANKEARRRAAQYLIDVAKSHEEFAKKNPGTIVAGFLFEEAKSIRGIATKASKEN